ncbi:MAG: hypothetical protein MJZ34_03110 [Paludibacteraceae bacterium]|nr:hypothetical protein [Paludibacteraceae bacterium]
MVVKSQQFADGRTLVEHVAKAAKEGGSIVKDIRNTYQKTEEAVRAYQNAMKDARLSAEKIGNDLKAGFRSARNYGKDLLSEGKVLKSILTSKTMTGLEKFEAIVNMISNRLQALLEVLGKDNAVFLDLSKAHEAATKFNVEELNLIKTVSNSAVRDVLAEGAANFSVMRTMVSNLESAFRTGDVKLFNEASNQLLSTAKNFKGAGDIKLWQKQIKDMGSMMNTKITGNTVAWPDVLADDAMRSAINMKTDKLLSFLGEAEAQWTGAVLREGKASPELANKLLNLQKASAKATDTERQLLKQAREEQQRLYEYVKPNDLEKQFLKKREVLSPERGSLKNITTLEDLEKLSDNPIAQAAMKHFSRK